MIAKCPKCGKSLKVRDEWAGKTLKCPGCATPFKAGDSAGPAASRASAPKGRPAAAGAGGTEPKSTRPVSHKVDDTPRFAINSNLLLLAGGLAILLAVIAIVMLGPMRVKRHWNENEQQARNTVDDVIDFALKCEGSRSGDYDPRRGRAPSVGDLRFLPEIFRLSVPETVEFDGFSSLGRLKDGSYNFATGEVTFTLKRGGTMLPSGVFLDDEGTAVAGGMRESAGNAAAAGGAIPGAKAARSAGGEVRVTGRVTSGRPSCELDGKKGEVIQPRALDEDGNPE